MVVEKIPHTVESKEIRFRGKPFEANTNAAFLAESQRFLRALLKFQRSLE